MSQRNQVEVGDVVEVTLLVKVKSVEHTNVEQVGFTALTFEHGAPYRNALGKISPPEWTLEIPDGYGRIVIEEPTDEP